MLMGKGKIVYILLLKAAECSGTRLWIQKGWFTIDWKIINLFWVLYLSEIQYFWQYLQNLLFIYQFPMLPFLIFRIQLTLQLLQFCRYLINLPLCVRYCIVFTRTIHVFFSKYIGGNRFGSRTSTHSMQLAMLRFTWWIKPLISSSVFHIYLAFR